jgi:hypothetical protein
MGAIVVRKIVLGILIATIAACCSHEPARAASGEAPWCIIDNEGDLHCWYADSAACLQQIAGGSHGFCLQNPSGAAASAPAQSQAPARRRRK